MQALSLQIVNPQQERDVSVKKIPKMLLGRCTFDKDDYRLNIITLPEVEYDEI